jgi:membrane-anchored protein YejM (alkaline phosphatase superfamily)
MLQSRTLKDSFLRCQQIFFVIGVEKWQNQRERYEGLNLLPADLISSDLTSLLLTTAHMRTLIAHRYVDSNIGKVLQALDDLGFADNTVVARCSDPVPLPSLAVNTP